MLRSIRRAPVTARLAVSLAVVLVGAGAAMAAALRCELCRNEIHGEYTYYEALDWSVCAECSSAPKCVGCALPLAGRLASGGDHCERCRQAAERCTACGRPILERGWRVRGVDGQFCDACRSEAPECSSCGAPARDGRVIAGRLFCRTCRPGLVRDPEVYRSLYRRVASRAREQLGLRIRDLPELTIDSREGLADRRGDPSVADEICGLYVRDGSGEATIHVLSHMTELRAAAVVAHELAHAWQGEQCPDDQGARIREGFAEWVAWKLLDGMEGTEPERALIAQRDDDYGLGFRIFAGIEERNGIEAVLRYARSARLGAAAP